MRTLASILVTLALLLPHGSGEAQEYTTIDETQAELVGRAVQAHNEGDYDRAADLWRAALLIKEVNALHLNLGRALQKSGSCQRADKAYQKALVAPALRERPSPEEVRANVEDFRAELRATCPGAVVVQCGEGTLQINDKAASCGVTIALLPGEHTALFTGRSGARTQKFTVTGMGVVEIDLTTEDDPILANDSADPGADPSTTPQVTTQDQGGSTMAVIGWTFVGVGAASLATGIYFSVEAGNIQDDIDAEGSKEEVDAQTARDLITSADAVERDQFVAYGVGAAMVATGAILLWMHSKDDAAISATPLPEGGGLLGYSARW